MASKPAILPDHLPKPKNDTGFIRAIIGSVQMLKTFGERKWQPLGPTTAEVGLRCMDATASANMNHMRYSKAS